MSLVEKLKERQGDKSQIAFARELGISQSALSLIYSGNRGIGAHVAKCITRRFPDLTWEMAAFLLGNNITPEQEIRSA